MSIGADLARIKGAKQSIRTAIEGKGVVVPAATRLDEYHSYVDAISGGGGGQSLFDIDFVGSSTVGGVTVERAAGNSIRLIGTATDNGELVLASGSPLLTTVAGSRYAIMDNGGLPYGYNCFLVGEGSGVNMAALIEQGGVATADGANQASMARTRSNYIAVAGNYHVRTASGWEFLVHRYTSTYVYAQAVSAAWSTNMEFSHEGFVRIVVRAADNRQITLAEAQQSAELNMVENEVYYEGITPPDTRALNIYEMRLQIYSGAVFAGTSIYPGAYELPTGGGA